MDSATLGLFIAGFVLLVGGAELLVRGAARLATAAGISPLVVGLTLVAFGTSAPELAVSLKATLSGQPSIALGNAVGSNIANVLLILGLSAAITPLVVSIQLIRVDVPLMIVSAAALFGMALDGAIGRADGLILIAALLGYVVLTVYLGRRAGAAARAEFEKEFGTFPSPTLASIAAHLMLVAIGLSLLVLGSDWLVDGAVALATWLGVSELIIGLTVVAVGTSLPEVATSIVAAVKGERDIAVGNIVGSNIFNVLCVVGVSSAVAPAGIAVPDAALQFDLPVMVAVALVCLPIFFTNFLIARWEGLLLLGYYIAYTTYLVLNATRHAALELFEAGMAWFVLPLTALTLIVLTAHSLRRPATSVS